MKNALFIYIIYKDIFRDRTDLKHHIRHNYQSVIKIKFQNGIVTEVKRAEDNMFKCKCGKDFKLPNSLRRHAKRCNNELIKSKENEEGVLMNILEDFDMSESMDMDDRIISTDCFGALISYEKC
jgi:uncharacterized Zn-finger protein